MISFHLTRVPGVGEKYAISHGFCQDLAKKRSGYVRIFHFFFHSSNKRIGGLLFLDYVRDFT